jgi:zinc/manganese transport system substrate-binding protein
MIRLLMTLLLAVVSVPAVAALHVFATVPEWGALAREIGGDKVSVFTATTALQDPHRIQARPSLLAQARRADLVVATGADLEVGWLPLVLRDSSNANIQPGRPGYFEAARFVTMLDLPVVLDRSQGDIHAAGNPHIQLDPRNLFRIGEALAIRLGEIDPPNAAAYQAGYKAFAGKWQVAIARWEKAALPLRGVAVLAHHDSFIYLANWLGFKTTGTLEPKPGIEPTSGQLSSLVARQQNIPAKMVLRTAYQNDGPSLWIAEKVGIPAVLLPFTVGGTPEAGDLFGLFDDTVRRMLKGLR